MVSSPYWKTLNELFAQAAKLPEAQRAAFVDANCGDDQKLRDELLSLLSNADSSEGHATLADLRGKVAQAVESLTDTDPWIGKELGPYRVLGELSSGGMGTVYEGVRSDHQFEQRVAIKRLHHLANTPELRRRFVAERQILANLVHPHIASLIDGGTADDGAPYLIMEYVDGDSITEYCQAQGLSIRERIALFVKVCDAVHYAHRNLVVHRDIKPGNILVDRAGVPKLLDFGIAKILDRSEDHAHTTVASQRLYTPEYASPEQVLGLPITTTSDVYSLGVLLYRLLTGVLPYSMDGASTAQIEQLIAQQPIERPSIASRRSPEGEAQRRVLQGDLDNIILYALHKEPERRYDSVGALQDDLRRYLSRQPVLAHPPSVGYHFRKFVERNKVLVVSIATMLTLTIGLVAFYTAQLATERDVANQERDTAQAVTELMVGVFEINDPSESRGQTITTREILERGNEKTLADDKQSPIIKSRLLEAIGSAYFGLGLYQQAEQNFARAAALLNSESNAELAQSNLRRRQAEAMAEYGDNAGAQAVFEQVLAIQRESLPAFATDLLRTHVSYGLTLYALGDINGSIEHCGRADAERISLANVDVLVLGYADACLGRSYLYQREFDTAQKYLSSAAALIEERYGTDHPALFDIYDNVGGNAFMRNDFRTAQQVWSENLARQRRVLGSDHADIGRTLASIGVTHLNLEQLDAAESYMRQSLAVYERTLPADHRDVAKSLYSLARLMYERFRYDEADELFSRTANIQRQNSQGDDSDLANTLAERALLQIELGNYAAAHENFDEAVRIYERVFGPNHIWLALTLGQQGGLFALQQQAEQGLALVDEGLRRARTHTAEDHRHMLTLKRYRGRALAQLGRTDEALTLLEQTLAAYNNPGSDNRLGFAVALMERAQILNDIERYSEAADDAQQALAIYESHLGKEHIGLADMTWQLARAQVGLRAPGAASLATRAAALQAELRPADHPKVQASRKLAGRQL